LGEGEHQPCVLIVATNCRDASSVALYVPLLGRTFAELLAAGTREAWWRGGGLHDGPSPEPQILDVFHVVPTFVILPSLRQPLHQLAYPEPQCDKGIACFAIESFVIMSHQQDVEAQNPPATAPTETAHHSAAVDSGIDAGSSSEFDQENNGEHALEAQDDTSEASTDEGYAAGSL